MKKRIISSIMCLAMLLSLLPVATFATDATDAANVTVSGYGFVWNGNSTNTGTDYTQGQQLPGGAVVGKDWMGQTMYVALKNTSTEKANLWFQVTVNSADADGDKAKADPEVWGCAGSVDASKGGTRAFSFLNRVGQWEQLPRTQGQQNYQDGLKAGDNVTLKVFTTDTLLTSDTYSNATLSNPVFEREITIPANSNNADGDLKATLLGTVGKANLVDQAEKPIEKLFDTYNVTAGNAGDNNIIPVTITATGLVKHTNAAQTPAEGYWIGFSVVAPDGAAKFKYAFGTTAESVKTLSTDSYDLEKAVNGTDDGIAFYVNAENKNTAKTYAAVQWLDSQNAVISEAAYHMDLNGVQLKSDEPAATTLTVAADTTTGTDLLGKAASDLQQNVKATAADSDNKITVTGDSKYITGWTGFHGTDPTQQSGHYVALKLTATPADAKITVPSPTEEKTKDLDPDGIWVVRLENFDNLSNINVVVTPKDGTETDKVTYTLDLSKITKETLGSIAVTEGTGENVVQSTISATLEGTTIKLAGVMLTPGDQGTALNLAYTSTLGNTETNGTPAKVTIAKDGTCATQKITYMGVEYTLDVTGIDLSPVEIAVSNPEPTVSDKIDADDQETVSNALGTLEIEGAGVLTSDETAKAAILAAANAVTDKQKEEYDDIKVEVGLKVEATGYTAPKAATDDAPAVPAALKLDITPVYTVTGKKEGKTEEIVKATKLNTSTLADSIVISITLPDGFVTDENDQVVTKHYNTDGKSVKEWLKTDITKGGSSPAFTYTASFDATSFSEYEIVADARTVNVTFDPGEGAAMEDNASTTATYTPADIGTILPKAVKTGATFSGWQIGTTGTTYTTLTDEMLTAMVAAADTGTVTLNAVFTTGGSTSGGNSGSSGGNVSSNVTIDRPTNGKVSVSPTAPSKGATVTITLTPDTGYQVGTVTVTDKDGKTVELTKVSDTKYTFTMPDGKVKVAATFTKAGAPTEGFTDVPADAYYADAVKWAVEKGITNGLTATTFGPNNSCTRGQMVTFLWRAAGSPTATGTNSFSDVASGEYYYNAVLWAVEKGITNGTSATTFSPNATVNRGQTVTFLYRYAGTPAATGASSFTDVAADAFYADAVKWAVAEEITNGTSSTTFSPASNCTRGQIVTFMYRQMAE